MIIHPLSTNKHLAIFAAVAAVSMSHSSHASVIAPCITFGLTDGTAQEFKNGTGLGTNSYTSATVTGHDVNHHGNDGNEGDFYFGLNDKAHFTLYASSADNVSLGGNGSGDVRDTKLGTGTAGSNIAMGSSITLKLSVSVDAGYQLKTLYLDYINIGNWDDNGTSSISFNDGTNTIEFEGANGTDVDKINTENDVGAQLFRYSGTPASGEYERGNGTYWRSPSNNANEYGNNELTEMANTLTTESVGKDGNNGTWEVTITNTSSHAISIDDVNIAFEVVASVPEPSSTALLGLTGVAFLLRRKRA